MHYKTTRIVFIIGLKGNRFSLLLHCFLSGINILFKKVENVILETKI